MACLKVGLNPYLLAADDQSRASPMRALLQPFAAKLACQM
jgi:hypothetical protein